MNVATPTPLAPPAPQDLMHRLAALAADSLDRLRHLEMRTEANRVLTGLAPLTPGEANGLRSAAGWWAEACQALADGVLTEGDYRTMIRLAEDCMLDAGDYRIQTQEADLLARAGLGA